MPHTIGIDLGGTTINGAIVNEKGHILHKQSLASETEHGPQALVKRISSLIELLIEQSPENIDAIGIGTPGVVDPKQGAVVSGCPNFPEWVGVPFMNILSQTHNKPVYAHNDVTIMAIGEQQWGAGQGKDHVICLTLGTGIGGGIIIDGNIYDGASRYAGEVGHMSIDPHGRACNCGSKGCWEAYASATGLITSAQKHSFSSEDGPLTAKYIFDQARNGHPSAQSLINEYILYLGVGIANLVNIFNPQAVVIGGGIAEAGEQLFGPLDAVVKQFSMDYAFQAVTIRPAQLGNDAGMIGAACYAQMHS